MELITQISAIPSSLEGGPSTVYALTDRGEIYYMRHSFGSSDEWRWWSLPGIHRETERYCE